MEHVSWGGGGQNPPFNCLRVNGGIVASTVSSMVGTRCIPRCLAVFVSDRPASSSPSRTSLLVLMHNAVVLLTLTFRPLTPVYSSYNCKMDWIWPAFCTARGVRLSSAYNMGPTVMSSSAVYMSSIKDVHKIRLRGSVNILRYLYSELLYGYSELQTLGPTDILSSEYSELRMFWATDIFLATNILATGILSYWSSELRIFWDTDIWTTDILSRPTSVTVTVLILNSRGHVLRVL